MQSKRHCSVSLPCDLITYCWPVYHSFLRATSFVAALQTAGGRQWLKHLLFDCTILISLMTASYAWANTKRIHKYATKTGRFMKVHTKHCLCVAPPLLFTVTSHAHPHEDFRKQNFMIFYL